jgi:hypothetical protein
MPKIILFGTDAASSHIAQRVEVEVIPGVATNSHGTPLVSDMFSQADRIATGDVVAFVSADIILSQSVIDAARIGSAWSNHFLLVAQRRDVDVRQPLDFESDAGLIDLAARGKLHSPGAIDLFVYPRGQYAGMPPFAIGRTSYDNWLLWNTTASGIPLIDATDYVTLLHQNHDYLHAPSVDVWNGVEALENRRWIQHWTHYYTIVHATWKLDADGRIVPATQWKYRMARPRQVLSHTLRATRRLRTRFKTWRSAQRYRS